MTQLVVEYESGDIIFSEGELGDSAYIIQEGIVVITSEVGGTHTRLAKLSKGQFFGELALIDNKPRVGTARAISKVKLHVINKEQLQSRIMEQDPVSQWLLKNVLGYLRSRIDRDKSEQSDLGDKTSLESNDSNNLQDSAENETVFSVMKLENELKQALNEGALHLEYQPIINFNNNQCMGFEVLIRWNNREDGPLSPAVFYAHGGANTALCHDWRMADLRNVPLFSRSKVQN